MDWPWVYGRVATALGCMPSAIDDEPVSNIFDLLTYWAEEPPTHVILALRYLGQKQKAKPVSKSEMEAQLQGFAAAMGGSVGMVNAPEGFLDAVTWAEEMQKKVAKRV